jgi:hypothetical protein
LTGAGLVDALIQDFLNIGNPAQLAESALRRRVLKHVNKRVRMLWRRYPWPFRIRESDVTAGTDGIIEAPADFGAMGKVGVLSYPAQRYNLRLTSPQRIAQLDALSPATSSRPLYYAVMSESTAADDINAHWFRVHPKPAIDITTLHLTYEAKAPVITDVIDDIGADVSSGMGFIPEDMHDVIETGAQADLAFDQGDGRWSAKEAEYRQGIAEAWAEEKADSHEASRMTPRYSRALARARGRSW